MADDTPSMTRRGLFRGLGTATLLATACKPKETAPPDEGPRPLAGGLVLPATPSPLEFELDGAMVQTQAAPSMTLAVLLRGPLGRTATKIACDRGACGACTVLVDDEPRNACMMLAHDVAGRRVTTTAGLTKDGTLSVLQRRFVEHDALQCGFCTPGMIASCEGLLRAAARTGRTRLDAEDVQAAIAGNLCRCGTYPHVIAAVLTTPIPNERSAMGSSGANAEGGTR
jgi:xanthine dehydrogenase YagT iron-sulfur-binding subunit